MTSLSKITTNHETIRNWAEKRNGKPVRAKEKNNNPEIVFDNNNNEEISWQEFFKLFDFNNLAMIYQENNDDGSISNFHKLVDRDKIYDEFADEDEEILDEED